MSGLSRGQRTSPRLEASREESSTLWRQRWGLWLSIGFACIAVIFFVSQITPLLPDVVLFWLKLVSFVMTAALGVIGVVTDFRDEQKKLTRPGKLNLAGLALAAVVGIMAQKAEYDSAAKSSAEAKKSFEKLVQQNQAVLGQVVRGLEPVGDTITVRYIVKIPLDNSELKSTRKYLNRKIADAVHSGLRGDKHTLFLASLSNPPLVVARFDRKSSLIPPDDAYGRPTLTQAPFVIQFFKSPPKLQSDCKSFPKPDLSYRWDSRSRGLQSRFAEFTESDLEDVELGYDPRNSWVGESAEGSIFRLENSSTALLSAVDFDQVYVRLLSNLLVPFEIEQLEIKIGQPAATGL